MNRTSLLLIAIFALTTTASCGDKKENEGSNKKTGGGILAKKDQKAPANRGSKKGGGKRLDEAAATALLGVTVPGFTQTTKVVRKNMAQISYKSEKPNAQGKSIGLFIMAQPCVMCRKLDLAKWKANENLKMMLPKAHKDNPELVWEVESLEAGGVTGIYTYRLSFTKGADGKRKSSSHGVTLYYNNGTNMVTVMVTGKRVFAKSLDELKTLITKEELVAAAKAALGAFATKL